MKPAVAFHNFSNATEKGIYNFLFVSKSPTSIAAYDNKEVKKSRSTLLFEKFKYFVTFT